MNYLSNSVGSVGTALGLPELGMSETINDGNTTVNTVAHQRQQVGPGTALGGNVQGMPFGQNAPLHTGTVLGTTTTGTPNSSAIRSYAASTG